MPDWTVFASRCLLAKEPNSDLAREISRPFMPRDDYPTIGTLLSNAVAVGEAESAFELVAILLPDWGCQVGHHPRKRIGTGWYATVFRPRDSTIPGDLGAIYSQDVAVANDRAPVRYASNSALAITAALCRALAAKDGA